MSKVQLAKILVPYKLNWNNVKDESSTTGCSLKNSIIHVSKSNFFFLGE